MIAMNVMSVSPGLDDEKGGIWWDVFSAVSLLHWTAFSTGSSKEGPG